MDPSNPETDSALARYDPYNEPKKKKNRQESQQEEERMDDEMGRVLM